MTVQASAPDLRSSRRSISYHTVEIDGLKIFYREAGPANAPTLLMLHGYPSSSPLWEARKKYWADPVHELENLKANFTSVGATRQRHIGSTPNPDRYDPDTWNDEYAFLSRPGQADIQATLFLDYRTNVASYPRWQKWLREVQPKMLVVWGKYDPSFSVAGATAYADDVPGAEIHILDAGHFALDEATDEIALLVRAFLERLDHQGG